MFLNAKDLIPRTEKSGICCLNYGECNSVYIGESSRKMKDRIEKHLTSIVNLTNQSTTFALLHVELAKRVDQHKNDEQNYNNSTTGDDAKY